MHEKKYIKIKGGKMIRQYFAQVSPVINDSIRESMVG